MMPMSIGVDSIIFNVSFVIKRIESDFLQLISNDLMMTGS